MDDIVKSALAKWPNVPHCYGWLALDRRGRWLLKGELLRLPNLDAFIARNYAHDDAGNWFFQNGPQRVYVELAYAPWVLHLTVDGLLETHTGQAVDDPVAAWIDDGGNLLLQWESGPALVDDRDLPMLLDAIRGANGRPASEEALHAAMAGEAVPLTFHWRNVDFPLGFIREADLPARYGFQRLPAANP
ncbi:MAG: DUF2946 family protein [Zoogloea sp.]|nr:DUF2946 family protein [Zoogloea sp.]